MKELFVLEKVRLSKVAWNKEAEEGEGAKDDVPFVEQVDDVVRVRGEGGNAEKDEWERKPVLHLPGKWKIRGCVMIQSDKFPGQRHFVDRAL